MHAWTHVVPVKGSRSYQFLPTLAFLPVRRYASAALDREGPVSVVWTCVSVPVSQISVLSERVDEWSDASESLLLMSSQVTR